MAGDAAAAFSRRRDQQHDQHRSSFGALAAVALLAACGSDSNSDQAATGTGGAGLGSGSVRPGSQEDLVANIGDRVFFDTDRSHDPRRPAPGAGAPGPLDAASTRRCRCMVEGHADERGTREYNLALGQRRANAARDVLVANGVAGARVPPSPTARTGRPRSAQRKTPGRRTAAR